MRAVGAFSTLLDAVANRGIMHIVPALILAAVAAHLLISSMRPAIRSKRIARLWRNRLAAAARIWPGLVTSVHCLAFNSVLRLGITLRDILEITH